MSWSISSSIASCSAYLAQLHHQLTYDQLMQIVGSEHRRRATLSTSSKQFELPQSIPSTQLRTNTRRNLRRPTWEPVGGGRIELERAIVRSQAKGADWKPAAARAAVDAVLAEAPDAPLEAVIVRALRLCLQSRGSS